MTRRTAIRIMRQAFAALTAKERGNLRYHAAKGTPVLCGPYAQLYYSNEWAGEDQEPPPGGA